MKRALSAIIALTVALVLSPAVPASASHSTALHSVWSESRDISPYSDGISGSRVKGAQAIMNRYGYHADVPWSECSDKTWGGRVTGTWNKCDRSAMARFQADHGMSSSAYVRSDEWKSMQHHVHSTNHPQGNNVCKAPGYFSAADSSSNTTTCRFGGSSHHPRQYTQLMKFHHGYWRWMAWDYSYGRYIWV